MSSRSATPHSTRRFDVCIRGNGVVGQTLALLLAREKLRVALIGPERAATAPADIRAYALNASARALLQSLRAWPEQDSAGAPGVTPVLRMEVHGDSGGSLQFSAADQSVDALNWIVDVPALEQQLSQAVRYQGGIECLDAPVPAPLTVICEGRRSPTRADMGLDYEVLPYPHKAIAARLRTERPHGGVARQWFSGGEILALLPLDGVQGNLVALVWSVPVPMADEWLNGPPEALAHVVQQRCGSALGDMQLEGQAKAWPLELSRARRWIAQVDGAGVALAGDAAHAMHPLAGQGLNVGLGDVAELARVIREREYWRELGDMRLLRRYERARQAEVSAMSWLTDGLFGLFGQGDPRVQALRNWGLNRVDQFAPLKHWLARKAMGQPG